MPPPITTHTLSNDTRVHQHTTDENAVNAYLIETPEEIVAVDATFLRSDAWDIREALDDLGKPLAAVFITHPHPDHVNGITVVRGDSKAPVFATESVDTTFREIELESREMWQPQYSEEYPDEITFPTDQVADGDRVSIGGVTLVAHDIGAGESPAATIWVLEDEHAAFVGDLVFNRAHPFLVEGRSGAWLDQLDTARELLTNDEVLFVGHGPAGDRHLLDYMAAYILAYRGAVAELADETPHLTEAAKRELDARMARILPDGALAGLVVMSADAVATELADDERPLDTPSQ
jgi:glyoxylase-like metal-dependent hydrolase (beta-lactamase superfamily II)